MKFDDFKEIKIEHQTNTGYLKAQLSVVTDKLKSIDMRSKLSFHSPIDIFADFQNLDLSDKKHIIHFIPPDNVNYETCDITIKLNNAMSKILVPKQ